MKRIITAVILLIFVLTAYFSGLFFIKNTCNTANDILSDCVTAYKNQNDAIEQAEKLEKFWSKKEPLLSAFVNHSSIDEIELAISNLTVYSHSTEKELFYEYSKTVRTLLHQIMEDTKPSMHSIL